MLAPVRRRAQLHGVCCAYVALCCELLVGHSLGIAVGCCEAQHGQHNLGVRGLQLAMYQVVNCVRNLLFAVGFLGHARTIAAPGAGLIDYFRVCRVRVLPVRFEGHGAVPDAGSAFLELLVRCAIRAEIHLDFPQLSALSFKTRYQNKPDTEQSLGSNARLSAKQVKEGGVHYTPPELARFLAAEIASHIQDVEGLRLLDPACGDAELLEALALALPPKARAAATLFGMENDAVALEHARQRLCALPECPRFELLHADFLDWTKDFNQPGIFGASAWPETFDAIISNPPYVRTQVMGASSAKKLAAQFGITGRVDLYHAFALAMTSVLREGGVLGLLCSNRFLTIQSGATLRKALLNYYELHDIFDLGDTKLFEAAVLPAVVIGTKRSVTQQHCGFTKIYEVHEASEDAGAPFPGVLAAVIAGAEDKIRVDDTVFLIERGKLAVASNSTEPWRISSPEQDTWLTGVRSKAPCTFADLVNIRVGIKTTADNVFIRNDWSTLPSEMQPEDEVLLPLVSNKVAAQWWPLPAKDRPYVLYTHTTENGKRVPIDFARYPRAQRYLEENREQLAGRKYVTEAGRRWYEIWVPQQPSDWRKPKIVFPDISTTAKFFLDTSGSIVDGNCYWFTAKEEDHLFLLLAIANSSFTLRFYDMVCGNKLYAGRRRFITQYVERFPVPEPGSSVARQIIARTKALYDLEPFSPDANATISEIDSLVWEGCSLVEEIAG